MGSSKKNEKIIREFWELMGQSRYAEAGMLMAEDVCIYLPNTREIFRGREKYVAFNERYPGTWTMQIKKIYSLEDAVITAVRAQAEGAPGFFVTSFFALKDGMITEMTEYWGENGEPPEWREKESPSERY
jgi:ketosteroid isomerase-like protein